MKVDRRTAYPNVQPFSAQLFCRLSFFLHATIEFSIACRAALPSDQPQYYTNIDEWNLCHTL
jgi:hypothetical protein